MIRDGSRILVWDEHNPATGEVVSVPLAGGIEFGETGQRAITRELAEEIGATPTRIQFLGLLEDIFDWAGQKRHELYLVYDVDLAGLFTTPKKLRFSSQTAPRTRRAGARSPISAAARDSFRTACSTSSPRQRDRAPAIDAREPLLALGVELDRLDAKPLG